MLPGEVVESPSVVIFKTLLDVTLCKLLWGNLLYDLQRSLPPQPLHDSVIYSALVSSALCHFPSDEFRTQLVLLEKDRDRLLKTVYFRLLKLGQ